MNLHKSTFRVFLIVFTFFSGVLSAYELGIISMFHNCAPYIKEWVEYHRLLGVDHFWLYDDASTDDWQSELSPYIQSGLVEVFYWPAPKPNFTGGQLEAFRDGLLRSVGVAKWITLLDQDEFILPMKDKTIPECLAKRFANVTAIYVNWLHFGTSKVVLADREPMLSRLVCCSKESHPLNAVGKSIIRPEYALVDLLWSQHFCPLKKGAFYVNGEGGRTYSVRDNVLYSLDHKHHPKYIRINHYAHRDEKYFFDVRVGRFDTEKDLIFDRYVAFNKKRNFDILLHLKNHFPKEFKKYWEPYIKVDLDL